MTGAVAIEAGLMYTVWYVDPTGATVLELLAAVAIKLE